MRRAVSSLTFIVPGLLDPVPYLDQLPVQDLPELPIFCKMLSRGEFSIPESLDNSHNNFYHCVMKELSLIEDGVVDLVSQPPIAAFSYLSDIKNLSETERLNCAISFDDSPEEKWIMRADPSFMAADRDQLVLAQTGSMDISIEEARTLADEINHFFNEFAEENFWTLKAVSPDRWYIVSDKPIAIQSVPPENVLGQSVKSFLPIGNEGSSHWLNLFNEFQMILHQSQVNKKRIAEKKLPINSLWFWGAGRAIDYSAVSRTHASYSKISVIKQPEMIYSNNLFVQNLSELNNQKCSHLPEKYAPENFLFNNSSSIKDESEQRIIYTIEDFIQVIRNKDIFTWVGLLKQFEKNYFVPLIKELEAGKIAQLEFVSPSGIRLLLTKKLLKRWWRKKQKYYSFLTDSNGFNQ